LFCLTCKLIDRLTIVAQVPSLRNSLSLFFIMSTTTTTSIASRKRPRLRRGRQAGKAKKAKTEHVVAVKTDGKTVARPIDAVYGVTTQEEAGAIWDHVRMLDPWIVIPAQPAQPRSIPAIDIEAANDEDDFPGYVPESPNYGGGRAEGVPPSDPAV
jgi:hypothetical protein